MAEMVRHALAPLFAMVLALLAFAYLKLQPSLDPHLAAPVTHFYVVTFIALVAAALTVAIGVAGSRLRNIQVVFLALAFSSLSLIFLLHGLSTPHLLLAPSRIPSIAAQLSILVTAFWLFLSALPSDHPVVTFFARRDRGLVPLWSACLLGFLVLAMLQPGLLEWLPVDRAPLRWFTAGLTGTLLLGAGYRYLQSYTYSRFPLQIAIVYATGFLSVVQLIMITGELWNLSWWLYHFLLLAALLLMVVGLWQQYVSGSNTTALRGLFASDPGERLAAGISPSVRALIIATEARDPLTAGHSSRVALHALRLGETLGLPPEELRALAQGGMVHDIGKLQIPDSVLNKPDGLDTAERKVIESHPAVGYEMCRRLGFMNLELQVIRSHHERWDGRGYPDGLKGEEIPRLARVLAIADVYDALTSARSYRSAWGFEHAKRYIVEGSGSQFDPACVEAWLRLSAEGPIDDIRLTTIRGPLKTSKALS